MLLYRSPDLLITDGVFVDRRGPGARYQVAELRNVRVVRVELRRPGRAVPVYGGAWAIVLILVAGVLDSPIVLALAMLTLGAAAAAGSWYARRGRRRWELRARYRGAEACLFATSDETTFGQVRRAVVRALEAREHL
jgi:hypothetical protein